MEKLIYKILKYHFGDCNLIELQREIDAVIKFYHLEGVKPIKNNSTFVEVAKFLFKDGAAEALGKLLYLITK